MDDAGDSVRVGPAGRLVSLNPVATELLFAAGAGPRVVGRTHWDTYPAEAASAPDLGNGIEPNVEAVVGAKPDLVVLYLSASNRKAAAALHAAIQKAETLHHDPAKQAQFLTSTGADSMAAVRAQSDALELTVGDDFWPLPRYREMLFPV